MRVQFGAIVTAGAGKAGGQIIQRGRTGQILRNLTKPVIRRDLNSFGPRAFLLKVASTWKIIADVDKVSWNSLAGTLVRYNKFGVAYTPNGYQIFCELNLNSFVLQDSPVIHTAPSPPDWPLADAITLTANPTGPSIVLDWTFTGGDVDFYVAPSFYPLQSMGVSVPRGSSRTCGSTALLTANTIDLTDNFVDRFGAPRGGEWQLALELKVIQSGTGWALPYFVEMVPFSSP